MMSDKKLEELAKELADLRKSHERLYDRFEKLSRDVWGHRTGRCPECRGKGEVVHLKRYGGYLRPATCPRCGGDRKFHEWNGKTRRRGR